MSAVAHMTGVTTDAQLRSFGAALYGLFAVLLAASPHTSSLSGGASPPDAVLCMFSPSLSVSYKFPQSRLLSVS